VPTIRRASKLLACALLIGMTQVAVAADWAYYEAKKYGFSMLVPTGTRISEKEWGGGWGELWAEYEGVKLRGLAKLGAKESDADIERFAVRTIGIPANEWKMIDSGRGRGWERYRTFEAVRGNNLYFGGYGVGPKGNYLLFLQTTVSDYNDHKSDYIKWYESVRLD
jgi:hypothetical protein